VLTGRSVTWTSENADIAAVLATGEVIGRSVGTTTINATIDNQTASAAITVTPPPISAVVVSPAGPQIFVGGTVDLEAQVTNAAGQVVLNAPLSWRSLAPGVATVDASGLVTGVAPGTAEIEATSEGKVGTTTVTVSAVPVRSVSVSPATADLFVTETVQLTATPRDANNEALPGRAVAWASVDPGVATVSTDGLVTAVAPGTTTITATSEGQTGTAQITVRLVPVQAVTVSPNAVTLVVGQERELTAAVTAAGGQPLDRPVAWSSSDTRVAVVESDGASGTARVIAVAEGRATITARSDNKTGTSAITVNAVPVASVSVSPKELELIVGQSAQFSAQALDGEGNVLSGRAIAWSSDDTDVATVDQSGRVAAVAPGSATITATSGGVRGTATVTVTRLPVTSVEVEPPSPTLTVGQTVQLDAIVRGPAGQPLSGRTVTWSSNKEEVATVSTTGLVTAVAQGDATITATSETRSGTAAVSVSPVPVASVRISPAEGLSLVVGQTKPLSAEGLSAANQPLPGRHVTWASDDEAIATVDEDGAVTGVAPGSTTIQATIEGVTATAPVAVSPVPVASVTVTPDSRSLIVGETAQLSVVVRDANNNELTGRAVTWTSSAEAVATVSNTGLVTAVGPGSATITATSEGQSGSASITVSPVPVASVRVAPASLALTVGESAPLTADPLDGRGNVLSGRPVTWESTDGEVATVDATGRVTAKAPGNATVRATSEGHTGTAIVTVTPVPVASVSVDPPSATLDVGDTRQLEATPRDADEKPLADRAVTWSSSDDNVASVNASGLVTAAGPGTATITATIETKTGTATIEVRPPAVASVSVSPAVADVIVGQTMQLTATPLDARGNPLTGRQIVWASEDEDVATVTVAGQVTAARVGQATIRATSEGKRGTATINALPVPVATVVVDPASVALIVGDQIDLTAEPRDAAGNPLTDRDIDWTSGDGNVASVDGNGRVTAVAVGNVTISATSGGQSGTSAVSVSAPVAASATAVAGDGQTGPAGEALPVALVVRVLDTRGRGISNIPVAWTVTEGGGSAAPLAPVTEAEGLASAVWTLGPDAGTNRLRAAAEGVPEVVDFSATATGAIVVSVEVTPGTSQLDAIGATTTLTARARGPQGQELPDAAIGWRSRNPDIATVDENGVVTARENGSAEIAAQSGGQEGAAVVVVQQRVVTITITPATPLVDEGAQVALTAAGADANGVAVTGATFTWESSDGAVATVDGAGLVTAVAPGTAIITARANDASGTTTVTVQAAAEPVVPVATRVVVPPDQVRPEARWSERLAARAFPSDGAPTRGTVSGDGPARGARKGKAVVAPIGAASDLAET
jgi:trimeric autotransporter adhesin